MWGSWRCEPRHPSVYAAQGAARAGCVPVGFGSRALHGRQLPLLGSHGSKLQHTWGSACVSSSARRADRAWTHVPGKRGRSTMGVCGGWRACGEAQYSGRRPCALRARAAAPQLPNSRQGSLCGQGHGLQQGAWDPLGQAASAGDGVGQSAGSRRRRRSHPYACAWASTGTCSDSPRETESLITALKDV